MVVFSFVAFFTVNQRRVQQRSKKRLDCAISFLVVVTSIWPSSVSCPAILFMYGKVAA